MRAVFNWLLRDIRADLKGMETRMSDKLDKIQAAEDRLGQSVARATSQNAANVKALADAIAKAQQPNATEADDKALDKILADTLAAADKLDAAFPATADETAAGGGDNPGATAVVQDVGQGQSTGVTLDQDTVSGT